MISEKKRLELKRGSLQYQYGERGRQLAQLRFNKHYTELSLEEFDKLFEELIQQVIQNLKIKSRG